jgi:hypothetical protein
MKDDQQIRFGGEGDQEPGLEPGDIMIVLDEKPHPMFKRRDQDLLMMMELELVEALCGFQKTVTTLDDRSLAIKVIPGVCSSRSSSPRATTIFGISPFYNLIFAKTLQSGFHNKSTTHKVDFDSRLYSFM